MSLTTKSDSFRSIDFPGVVLIVRGAVVSSYVDKFGVGRNTLSHSGAKLHTSAGYGLCPRMETLAKHLAAAPDGAVVECFYNRCVYANLTLCPDSSLRESAGGGSHRRDSPRHSKVVCS